MMVLPNFTYVVLTHIFFCVSMASMYCDYGLPPMVQYIISGLSITMAIFLQARSTKLKDVVNKGIPELLFIVSIIMATSIFLKRYTTLYSSDIIYLLTFAGFMLLNLLLPREEIESMTTTERNMHLTSRHTTTFCVGLGLGILSTLLFFDYEVDMSKYFLLPAMLIYYIYSIGNVTYLTMSEKDQQHQYMFYCLLPLASAGVAWIARYIF